jgi:hypothetical protein
LSGETGVFGVVADHALAEYESMAQRRVAEKLGDPPGAHSLKRQSQGVAHRLTQQ